MDGRADSDSRDDGPDTVELGNLDVAVAHWHVNAWGGAEYLVTRLTEALDVDTVYTIGEPTPTDPNPYGDVDFYDVTADLDLRLIRWIQRSVGRAAEYALWEDVDWREYGDPDVLITSGATTRAVITSDDTLHLNYCHSPPRWLYDLYHDRKDSIVGQLARPLVRYLRMRDATVDPRVDGYFANSPIVARRIRKFYDRDSEVLYPPVDLLKYEDRGDEGFYLHLGRLDREKGVPAVVDAFAEGDHRLVMAGGRGDVSEAVMNRIRGADTIDYRGFVDESEKLDLLATCRALVFNGRDEDFGIVPIEANASGNAVLTRDEGFPGIFVEDGENGYRHDGSVGGIRDVIRQFEREGIEGAPRDCAVQFDVSGFRTQLHSQIAHRHDDFGLY